MPEVNRNTTQRDRDRAALRRTAAPCALCGYPIDYSLPHTDPMSFQADHIIPLRPADGSPGGPDTLANKQATHRSCNRVKWHKTEGRPAPREFVTARAW